MSLFTRTYMLQWTAPSRTLKAVASDLHERIREHVLNQVAKSEPVTFVSCGLANPPGPTRLVLEDRRKGLPGRRFSAVLTHEDSQIVLRIEASRLRPLPLELLEPLLRAVNALAAPETPAWAKD